MKKITTNEFEKEVEKSEKPVIVKFYAEWCGPCKALTPILEEVDNEVEDVTVVEVNVDDSGELAQKFGVRGIPTMLFMKDGQVKATMVGNQAKAEILKKIKESF